MNSASGTSWWAMQKHGSVCNLITFNMIYQTCVYKSTEQNFPYPVKKVNSRKPLFKDWNYLRHFHEWSNAICCVFIYFCFDLNLKNQRNNTKCELMLRFWMLYSFGYENDAKFTKTRKLRHCLLKKFTLNFIFQSSLQTMPSNMTKQLRDQDLLQRKAAVAAVAKAKKEGLQEIIKLTNPTVLCHFLF